MYAILTPTQQHVRPDAVSLCSDGAVDEHVEVQALHQDPRLCGADSEHEEDRDETALPVLKVTTSRVKVNMGSVVSFFR